MIGAPDDPLPGSGAGPAPEDLPGDLHVPGPPAEPRGTLPGAGGPAPSGPVVGTLVQPSVRATRDDPVARAASEVIGGPAGRRAVPGLRCGGAWKLGVVPALVLVAVVTLFCGVLQKQHCRDEGWSDPDQFWHACYSDSAVLFSSSDLGGEDRPGFWDALDPEAAGSLGQTPLLGAAIWVASSVVDGADGEGPRRFFDLSAVLMAGALAATVVLVGAVSGRRPADAAHVAAAPVLVTVGLVSYDLLPVALATGALVAWARRRPAAAGVLLGLAVLGRPVLAGIALAVIAVGLRTARYRAPLVMAGTAAATWASLRLVLLPGWDGGLGAAWRSWQAAGPGYGSLWLVPSLVSQSRPDGAALWYDGGGPDSGTTTVGVMVGIFVVVVATVALALGAPVRPRVAHLALFACCGLMLVTKSLPVQASLLLLPLIALSGLRWRDHLVWATTELVHFVGVWLFIAAPSNSTKGLPAGMYLLMLLLRLGGIVWIASRAVRACHDPRTDPVRVPEDEGPGRDDPLGGDLEGSRDALIITMA